MKRAVVVGGTGGIGAALCDELVHGGWWVGVVGRDPERVRRKVSRLRSDGDGGVVAGAVCDVEVEGAVGRAFDELLIALGQIDLLVYCAGTMLPESSTEDRLRALGPVLAVNVDGAVRWMERAADYLVEVGAGRIAGVGSIAGDRGRKGHPVYGASKAALEHYLEGLRHRLHGTGVGVTTIKPGWVRTSMLPEPMHASSLAVSPERAARRIVAGLERGRESFYVPAWWGAVGLGLRLLPRWLYKRIAPA